MPPRRPILPLIECGLSNCELPLGRLAKLLLPGGNGWQFKALICLFQPFQHLPGRIVLPLSQVATYQTVPYRSPRPWPSLGTSDYDRREPGECPMSRGSGRLGTHGENRARDSGRSLAAVPVDPDSSSLRKTTRQRPRPFPPHPPDPWPQPAAIARKAQCERWNSRRLNIPGRVQRFDAA